MATALLRRAAAGETGAVLRVSRPGAPLVAFGRRDVRLPGFAEAVRLAADAGFGAGVRAPGGRAVAFTRDAVLLDLVVPDADAGAGMRARFTTYGEAVADVLRAHGVDARVGEVPGEYCPGSHSVNARGEVKLVGTGQRVVRGGWLFGAVVVLGGADRLRPVLTDVHAALGLPFAAASVGDVRGEAPDVDEVTLVADLAAALGAEGPAHPLDAATRALATALLPDHRPPAPLA